MRSRGIRKRSLGGACRLLYHHGRGGGGQHILYARPTLQRVSGYSAHRAAPLCPRPLCSSVIYKQRPGPFGGLATPSHLSTPPQPCADTRATTRSQALSGNSLCRRQSWWKAHPSETGGGGGRSTWRGRMNKPTMLHVASHHALLCFNAHSALDT